MKQKLFIAVALLVAASLFLMPVAVNAGLPKPPLPPPPPLLPPPPPPGLVPPPPPVVAPEKDRGRHEGEYKKKKHKKHKDRHHKGHGDDD